MLRWRVRRLLLGGVGCDRGQHDAASDLVAVGAGRSPSRGAPLPWPHELALPSPPSDGGFARRARRSSARGLLVACSWGGTMRCSLLFAARRGAASSYAGLLFVPLPSGWGVMVAPPRPSRCCRCCSLRSVRWCAEIVAPLVRRARTLVAVRRRARACLRARLRSGRDVGGTMFGSPLGRHDAAANSGCRGRGADGRRVSPAAVARARRRAS